MKSRAPRCSDARFFVSGLNLNGSASDASTGAADSASAITQENATHAVTRSGSGRVLSIREYQGMPRKTRNR